MSDFSYGIITVSDSCHLGVNTDESGPAIKVYLQSSYSATKISQSIVPDEIDAIEKMLKFYSDDLKLHCIFTTGGTGFAPRDVTPEATRRIIHRECPQLALLMALESFKKTQFAALSRAVCGIRDKTLIINFPGSKKAVIECFEAIQPVLIHAIQLIRDEKVETVETHRKLLSDFKISTPYAGSEMSEVSEISELLDRSSTSMEEIVLKNDFMKTPARGDNLNISQQSLSGTSNGSKSSTSRPHHVCPHKTAVAGDADDRNSPFPMIEVDDALRKVFDTVPRLSTPFDVLSPMNCPPFRASVKDGYAIKSKSREKIRKVIGYIPAGDMIIQEDFADNECYKINTGAAVPEFADAIIQVEDTKLLEKNEDGTERLIELLRFPEANCDIRQIGSDMKEGELMFKTSGLMSVPENTILASVGLSTNQRKPKIAIITTGDEIVDPMSGGLRQGQIYDSNTTMLKLLLQKFGFDATSAEIAKDDYESLKGIVQQAMEECDVIISSGGVSMGDKDFVKPLMTELGFEILFGRVNMKPGKPMTFASNGKVSYFALPGNPVSAFVTFHLFVLPALRYMSGFAEAKCKLPVISVLLQKDKYVLDSRPEYARATVTFINTRGYLAHITDDQISSRLASLINADVLLHLPGATAAVKSINRGYKLQASVLDHFFISNYQA